MKYPKLIGLCKNCLGCQRLESPDFKGVYRCKWNKGEIKDEDRNTNEITKFKSIHK